MNAVERPLPVPDPATAPYWAAAHENRLVMPHCQSAMVTRCLENGVFAVTANRVGDEHRPPRPPLHFTGESVIVSPQGETLARGSPERPGSLSVRVDVARARDKRLGSGNDAFADRRPDLYRLGP